MSTSSPSLIHVIFGDGFPMALHWRLTSWFSMTTVSDGLVIKLVVSEIEIKISLPRESQSNLSKWLRN